MILCFAKICGSATCMISKRTGGLRKFGIIAVPGTHAIELPSETQSSHVSRQQKTKLPAFCLPCRKRIVRLSLKRITVRSVVQEGGNE